MQDVSDFDIAIVEYNYSYLSTAISECFLIVQTWSKIELVYNNFKKLHIICLLLSTAQKYICHYICPIFDGYNGEINKASDRTV